MRLSFSEIRKVLCDAFSAAYPGSGGDIVDIYQDRCIIRDGSGAMYEVPYSIDAEGKVITGDMTKVRRTVDYVMVQANSIALQAEQEVSGVPRQIQVVPFGRHNTPKGPFEVTTAEAPLIIGAFERQVNDMVIDYEHQTLADPPVEAPAAGWIKSLVDRGTEGIWAGVEWTPRAAQMIANKEYRYVSPVWVKRRSDDRVIALINVALTNSPNIDGMVPLINKSSMFNVQRSTLKNPIEEDEMDKELLKALGLAEGATVEQAIAAIDTLRAQRTVANKAVLTVLGLPETASESEVTGTIMAMKQSHTSVDSLISQVNSLTAKLADREATEAVENALKLGKITPAQVEWATGYAKRDLAGFQVFTNKAPTVVFQGKIVADDRSQDTGIDDTQTQINKMCGIDEETYKKYSPKDE